MGEYPHTFGNRENFDFNDGCPADGNLYEYPLKKGTRYDGGPNNKKAGKERVVYYYNPSGNSGAPNPIVVFCGIMTHEGQPKGRFRLC